MSLNTNLSPSTSSYPPKAPDTPVTPIKTPTSKQKMTQRERKAAARQQVSQPLETLRPPTNPWAIPNSASVSSSFPEKSPLLKPQTPVHHLRNGIPIFQETPGSAKNSAQASPWKIQTAGTSPLSPMPSGSLGSSPQGWKTSPASLAPPSFLTMPSTSPKPVSFKSFTEIQEQQRQEALNVAKMEKRCKKSLMAIQIEENAKQQILEFYVASSQPGSGEYFEIRTEMR